MGREREGEGKRGRERDTEGHLSERRDMCGVCSWGRRKAFLWFESERPDQALYHTFRV